MRARTPVAQGEAADADAHLELGGLALEKRVGDPAGRPTSRWSAEPHAESWQFAKFDECMFPRA
jgi:hypothetical protein